MAATFVSAHVAQEKGAVARALAATLRAPAAPGRTYELVGPEVLTDKEIALAVLDLIREPRATLSIPPARHCWSRCRRTIPLLTRDRCWVLNSRQRKPKN